jgi:hypothetical protein
VSEEWIRFRMVSIIPGIPIAIVREREGGRERERERERDTD